MNSDNTKIVELHFGEKMPEAAIEQLRQSKVEFVASSYTFRAEGNYFQTPLVPRTNNRLVRITVEVLGE